MITHKDALGRPIKLGDIVAFTDSYNEIPYEFQTTGGLPVIKVTNCYVWLQWPEEGETFRLSPCKVFVITDQVKTNLQDYPELYI